MEGRVNIIWDDISNYYSTKAYPEINKIENLLRKLITYFMISNFGQEWTEESIPLEVKNSIKNNRDKNNFLHNTDFIQLADYLFKPYSSKNVEILLRDIKKDSFNEDKKYLEQFVSKSNWERYFNNYVNCEDGFLLKNWTKLYELRCLVAHNSFINKNEFDEIISIIENLKGKFIDAISAIDDIIIPNDEKVTVIENVVSLKNELVNDFLSKWYPIYEEVYKLYIKNGYAADTSKPLREMVSDLTSKKVLTDEFSENLAIIGNIRQKIIHFEETLSDEEIINATNLAEEFYDNYILLEAPFYE
nr:HEPN domain-containing protein [Chryseobacterium turcicum]